ncbi:MAG: ABC transporter permease, partial [Oscillospiraceae bacterium]|nr:ABC transporter permease [Oscillospiraceae bacterium]
GVILGGVIYYVVYQTVIFLGLDTDLLKMFSAIVVAIFLAFPYLKKKYFSKPVKKQSKEVAKNA